MLRDIKKVFPFLNKTKCYRIFVESDGTTVTITNSDLAGVSVLSTGLKLPVDFAVTDYAIDYHFVAPSSAQSIQKKLTVNTNGSISIATLPASAFDYGYIYVYGYTQA